MSAVPRPKKLTVAEYLAIEEASEVRHEFFNGELFAMAGATVAHNRVKENLIGEMFGQLTAGGCWSYSSDQRVHVTTTGLYTYPDVLIVCGPPTFDPADPNSITNPRVVIEVLSPSTAGYDRGDKFRHYQRLPSVQEYVLVSQDRVQVERQVRQPDGSWNLTTFDDPSGELAFATIPVRVPLAGVYRGVNLPDAPPLR